MSNTFPDPRNAPGDEPLAVGGDLSVGTLIEAYKTGIFPWPDSNGTLWWWSPDPRAVLPLEGLHISRSLRRTLRRGHLSCTRDAAFEDVVAGCADRPGEGTWISPAMAVAYARLHRVGVAHSVEVWSGQRLVGGLYGLALGAVFCAESMYSAVPDASKVALVHLVGHLTKRGFSLFDAQVPTPHLATLGVVPVTRDAFLDRLAAAVTRPMTF